MMHEEDESVANRLKAIKDLMHSEHKISNDNDILELTEDDLYDEQQDEDFLPTESDNITNVNENLTKILQNSNNDLNEVKNHKVNNEGHLIEEASATKSVESLKALIKKLEKTTAEVAKNTKNITLEEVVTDTLKPYLKDWLSQYLHSIVQGIVDKEVQKLVIKKD